ncbi:50S ribosomal protein L10 [Corynebacterium provencense]|jgi:large subunit ribosomal protein L10|uniref:Large ribosomal subunit protein uL10 n=1 Tax=Corynebacterium provencense TaxID=1737425 RepID=A0A2Z3YTK9_9CORY|nr:50S ribosomal protein L10 [Corynebacterium provencense]AWT25377.1 50S ribosomal protein L10 [Corynebacterium provencense]MCI1256237.1 50S ribosomal protein L10 [Corynebacterium provencense]
MANAKNTESVAELTARFEDASAAILTEYRGLTVAETTELRKALGADVTYSVAKNTMIRLAAKQAGVELDDAQLTGPTAIAFVRGEAVDAAKAMKAFGGEHKSFVIKGGNMDGNTLSAAQVEAIAELDNRETTLAKLAGALQGSLTKAAQLFNAPASQVARLAAALQEKKEAA